MHSVISHTTAFFTKYEYDNSLMSFDTNNVRSLLATSLKSDGNMTHPAWSNRMLHYRITRSNVVWCPPGKQRRRGWQRGCGRWVQHPEPRVWIAWEQQWSKYGYNKINVPVLLSFRKNLILSMFVLRILLESQYFDRRKMKPVEVAENFITWTLRHVKLEWSSLWGWDGRGNVASMGWLGMHI
jgi:hypothetical protein